MTNDLIRKAGLVIAASAGVALFVLLFILTDQMRKASMELAQKEGVAVGPTSLPKDTARPGMFRFTNEEFKFSLSIPRSWKLQQTDYGSAGLGLFWFWSDDYEQGDDEEYLNPPILSGEFLKVYIQEERNQPVGYESGEDLETYMIGGWKGEKSFVREGETMEMDSETMVVAVHTESYYYQFWCDYGLGYRDEAIENCKEILETVEFLE